MKPIKNLKELKKGDWISTQRIFRATSDNKLVGTRKIAKIINVKGKDINISCWDIVGEEIKKGMIFGRNKELFLLEEKEIREYEKRLMLMELEK